MPSINMKIRRSSRRGQATIIGLLVTVAIIVILAAWLYPRYLKSGGVGGSVSSPEQEADDVACGTYYQQIGAAIVEYKDQHGTPPPNLPALRTEGVTSDMYADSSCGFVYNPQTGMLGDKDIALPSRPVAPAGSPTATTPVPSAAPSPVPPSNAPSTDLYSKAQNAGSAGQAPSDLLNGSN